MKMMVECSVMRMIMLEVRKYWIRRRCATFRLGSI